MDQGTFCADRNTMAMLAIAKSLPDALKVVVTSHSEPTEDGLLQLHIGLDGAFHTVPFRHGMRMEQLKEKVLKTTGIPMEEQMYVFADDARLVDADALVPLDEPLRCIRSRQTPPASELVTTEEETEAEQDSSDSAKHFKESDSSSGASRCPRAARESWADISDEADGLITSFLGYSLQGVAGAVAVDGLLWQLNGSLGQQPDRAHAAVGAHDEPPLAQGSSLARCFTERWRQWESGEHQHQFYIGIPEDQIEECQVVQQIKDACPRIYKANVMVRLRGRGSGFLEGRRRKESTDPMMICISGRIGYSLDDYWVSFYMIASLLEDEIYARYNRAIAERCQHSEIHLEDDGVHGGVRLHGEAKSLCPETPEDEVLKRTNTSNITLAHQFTDTWRAWDEHERQHQFYIAIPEASRDEFQVVRRIKNACRSIFSDQVMLRCRGKGSGFIEGRQKAESSDPLMVCLSGRDRYSLDHYWSAFYELATFLEDDLYAEYNASMAKHPATRNKQVSQAHLNHNATHGGVRKGGRVNEP